MIINKISSLQIQFIGRKTWEWPVDKYKLQEVKHLKFENKKRICLNLNRNKKEDD